MSEESIIRVSEVEKIYKLYDRPKDRLKDAFGLCRGEKKPYRLHYALRGVSLEVHRGETVGIIGTNGSGKSTLLKIITGVLTPSGGKVEVDGRISALLELGAGFNMEYNGIENIYLNGTMMGFSEKEIQQKIPAILEFADIGDYVNQPVKTYSSGMFVRLAFALAINIEPEILIVDEALSVGDVFFQAKCYRKFEEFKEQGRTIVFVSHDLSSISKYCDRVYLLNKGVMLGCGNPKEMIDAYKQVLVGQYPLPEETGTEVTDSAGTSSEDGGSSEDVSPTGAENGDAGRSDALEYGTRQALITSYGVLDSKGRESTTLLKGEEFTVYFDVEFQDSLPAPIFALSIKNAKGTEITGTNTMLEKAFLDSVAAGECKHVTLTQRMTLQGGEYLLSFGVTGFQGDDFQVYHRLYDVVGITVVSDKDTVGYFDMESVVKVTEGKK